MTGTQVSWAQQTYYMEPAHRTKRSDGIWTATCTVVDPDYVFVGVAEGMLPEVTVVLRGNLFVAAAPIDILARSYEAKCGKQAADITALLGYLTGSTHKDLQKSLPEQPPWLCWHVLKPGQLLQTPPGFVRAEGKLPGRVWYVEVWVTRYAGCALACSMNGCRRCRRVRLLCVGFSVPAACCAVCSYSITVRRGSVHDGY